MKLSKNKSFKLFIYILMSIAFLSSFNCLMVLLFNELKTPSEIDGVRQLICLFLILNMALIGLSIKLIADFLVKFMDSSVAEAVIQERIINKLKKDIK